VIISCWNVEDAEHSYKQAMKWSFYPVMAHS